MAAPGEWTWIQLATVLAIHDRQLAEHGGMPGIRDMGLVESALARPRTLLDYGTPDVFDLAAASGWGLARNHGFIDGNKRTAYVVTRLFLRLHGRDLAAESTTRVLVFERVGTGTMSQEELAAWMRGG